MTQRPTGISAAIKAVHVCRRQVQGLEEDDTWRDYLQKVTSKRSLREMSDRELGLVIDALRHDGASAKSKPSSKAHVRKVYAIWSDMCRQGIPDNPTKEGLNAFVQRMTSVQHPNWMSPAESQKVVEGLKAWLRRELKKREASGPSGKEQVGL